MLMLNFENDEISYAIHSQCFTRIIKNDDILVTTFDYQSWDRKYEENNDFMYNLKKFKSNIEDAIVLLVEVNSLCDIIITLDNGVTIQIFIQNSYSHFDDEWEQYRFFEASSDNETKEQGNLPPHYVVYNKHIEIHS